MKPRISVIIISYNQEDVISRTIDSLMGQECLYEICVSDDCSSDRTWEILNEYSLKNPGLFKLNRNDPNLGIFANEEQTWKMPTGDIIYRIAGDDECTPGYFAKVVDYLETNNIKWQEELFCVVGDNLTLYPDGKSYVSRNDCLSRKVSPLSLKIRGLLNDRSACFSRKVLEKYIPVSRGRSFVVEEAQDDQLEIFSESFYHIPVCGNVYYAETGVSAHLSPEDKLQRVSIFEYFLEFISSLGISLGRKDLDYIRYRTEYLRFGATRSFAALFKSLYYFLRSVDLRLGLEGLEIGHLFNAIKRKIAR